MLLLLPDVDDIYEVTGEVEVDGGLYGATCDVCCLCLPSCFFVVVVVVGSSNDATTSFFGPAAHAAQNEKLQKEREERREGGQITVLSFLWRRQGSANHNQAINLSLIRHQMTLKAS